MSYFDELTLDEINCIEELKRITINEVTPKLIDDPSLFYRFCKARNFNLEQASSMLRKHISWRKEYGIDTILEDFTPSEVLKKYVPFNVLGFDNEGHPLRYVAMSSVDTKGLFKSAKKRDITNYNLQNMEKDVEILKQQSQKLQRPITQFVYIFNFDKLTLAKATHKESIQFLLLWINTFQDNYPERIKSIYIINASVYFTVLFSICKSMVSAAILKKIHCFGSDGWKEALSKITSPDVLPAFLGGNLTDSDGNPLCNSFIIHGGEIPESYYLKNSKRTLHDEPGIKELIVTRLSHSELTFTITEPGMVLEWEFEIKEKDIAFGLYFKRKLIDVLEPIELLPKQKVDTSFEPETGLYKCEEPGIYILKFDNSYSWLFSKRIYYRIKILSGNELREKNGKEY